MICFPSGPVFHNGYGGQVGTPGKGVRDGHIQTFIGNVAAVMYDGSSYGKEMLMAGSPFSRAFGLPCALTTAHTRLTSPRACRPIHGAAKPICQAPGKSVMSDNTIYSPAGQTKK